MKNAKIIVVLALLTLFLSGCANVDRSEVSAPSSQEMVAIEPCTKHRAAGDQSGFCFGKYRDSRREYGQTRNGESTAGGFNTCQRGNAARRQQSHGNCPAETT